MRIIRMPKSPFPNLRTIKAGLGPILRLAEPGAGALVGIERRPNPYVSSAPSEIVFCRFDSGEGLQLLLKYDVSKPSADYGHWGSVGHEIRVYRDILQTLPILVPKYYGAFTIGATGQRCLVLQWLDGALRLGKAVETRTAMILAAQWLGQFHAAAEARLLEAPIRFLNTYDTRYYARWARRTLKSSRTLLESYSWLSALCARFEEASAGLAKGPLTVIHGEYYPDNILVCENAVYPVDWQSTSVARGEVDLASLTEGEWGQNIEAQCEDEYRRSRWGNGGPDDLEAVLTLARVYWPLRWLGHDPKRNLQPRYQKVIDRLRVQGERAGLI
jgi:thiamine kinase-like enzyme